MKVAQSIAAICAGIIVNVFVPVAILFPIAEAVVSPRWFASHMPASGILLGSVEVGTAAVLAGGVIGLLAPSNAKIHALVVGAVAVAALLWSGKKSPLPLPVMVLIIVAQVLVLAIAATLVERWKNRRQRQHVAPA